MQARRGRPHDPESAAQDVAALISEHVGGARDRRGSDWEPSPRILERALVLARRRGQRRNALVGLTCALVLVGAGFAVRSLVGRESDQLSYHIDPLASESPARVSPSEETSRAAQFSFSDGTRIELAAGGRGRVADVTHHGARFVLDDGKARVHVIHRPGAEWSFAAGPYAIDVHGTAFSLEWNAGRKWLDVKMESGVVSVRGPVPGGRVVLRAGQSLSVGVADGGSSRSAPDPTPAEPSEPAGSAEPPMLAPLAPARASEHRVMPSGAARPRAQVNAAAPPSWSHQLDEGRAGAIIADAEHRGLERVLRESGSDELSALADAARYIRRHDLARQALRAQMRRFPSSPRARDALFFLGRITEETGGGSFDVLESYDRYLRDTPDGTYASEALGRKMIILERMNRDADARQIAGDYLRRFPRGTYAHAAQAVARAR